MAVRKLDIGTKARTYGLKSRTNSAAIKFEREPLGIPATGGPPACRVVDSPYAL